MRLLPMLMDGGLLIAVYLVTCIVLMRVFNL